MSTYTVYDLAESARSIPTDFLIVRVVEAWGHSPEDYGSWNGGFLLEAPDGRYGYLTGWCDTSGWGCQDGTDWYSFDHRPTHDEMVAAQKLQAWEYRPDDTEWDPEPADLNRWVKAGFPRPYTKGWDRSMRGVDVHR